MFLRISDAFSDTNELEWLNREWYGRERGLGASGTRSRPGDGDAANGRVGRDLGEA